jgi:hypothetical protein
MLQPHVRVESLLLRQTTSQRILQEFSGVLQWGLFQPLLYGAVTIPGTSFALRLPKSGSKWAQRLYESYSVEGCTGICKRLVFGSIVSGVDKAVLAK